MHLRTSSRAVIGCMILVSTASAQSIHNLPSCWQTCIKDRGPQCSDTNLDCTRPSSPNPMTAIKHKADSNSATGACHFASTPNLLPLLISCVRTQCTDTSPAGYLVSPFEALQTACASTQYQISDDDVASVGAAATIPKATDTVTATALTRPHKIIAAVATTAILAATGSPLAVPGTTAGHSAGSKPVVVLSATSPASSASTATTSSGSNNGGTILDQAGTSGSKREVENALVLLGLGLCSVAGHMLL